MDENEIHFFILLNVWIIMAQVFTMNAQLLRYRQQQRRQRERASLEQRTFVRLHVRREEINRITQMSDTNCLWELRMDRNAFAILCDLLKTRGGLLDDGHVTIEEQVATFVNILAHHNKNRSIQVRFIRSGETISRYVHRVLRALLSLQDMLFAKPTPIPEDCTESRWRCFKGCLGALDGTYIGVTVPEADRPRYRTRKGHIATNVLGVCTPDLKFVYVLSGWEGSATDSRVLGDAVTRANGLKVPTDYMATSRNWIDHEEDVLLTILEEMVADGVRCETGSFKAGTFVMVASKMKEQIPGINIEPKHIQNKLKRLKEKYSSAYDMMNTSGFGWDEGKKCVVVDSDEILQEWVKKHPTASCKPNKPFPLYPRLCTVFGRDRATGSMAESAADAIENMGLESEECETSEMPPSSPTPPSIATSSASQPVRKRKRSRNDGDANIVSVISEGWNKAVTEMKKLGESFTFGEAKARLPSELQVMGLPYDQVLKISMKLVKDTDLMRIWSTLDDSQKPDFIKVFMESL